MKGHLTIGQYLLARLEAEGVRHVFGIPGDYVLSFYDLLQNSTLRVINTCDEQAAGFAADAYARIRGLGAPTRNDPRLVRPKGWLTHQGLHSGALRAQSPARV